MGWPVTAEVRITTMHADKRLGHGRGLQLLHRAYCAVKGHRWTTWRFDVPEYDDFEMERAIEFGPGDDDKALFWYRGCRRLCGTVQSTNLPKKREQELPT